MTDQSATKSRCPNDCVKMAKMYNVIILAAKKKTQENRTTQSQNVRYPINKVFLKYWLTVDTE